MIYAVICAEVEDAKQRVHESVDDMALQAQVEILRDVLKASFHLRQFASWHLRSAGQIRRFEAAKLKQGEAK